MPSSTPDSYLRRDQAHLIHPLHNRRLHETAGHVNVDHLLPALRVPVLVMHARGDQRVGFEEGRRLAGLIPNARLVSLESRNHLLQESEPAWPRFLAEFGLE